VLLWPDSVPKMAWDTQQVAVEEGFRMRGLRAAQRMR
jgi:hypothetical protein